MAAQAPTLGEPFFQHVHGAGADLVDRSNIPAEVMMARRIRACEGDHVMITAMNAVHERDIVAGIVGDAHAEHPRIKFDRFRHVGGEHKDVRETPGPCARHRAAKRRPAFTRAD